jgi:hypothetical protein
MLLIREVMSIGFGHRYFGGLFSYQSQQYWCSLPLRVFATALRSLRFPPWFYRKGRKELAKERKGTPI